MFVELKRNCQNKIKTDQKTKTIQILTVDKNAVQSNIKWDVWSLIHLFKSCLLVFCFNGSYFSPEIQNIHTVNPPHLSLCTMNQNIFLGRIGCFLGETFTIRQKHGLSVCYFYYFYATCFSFLITLHIFTLSSQA